MIEVPQRIRLTKFEGPEDSRLTKKFILNEESYIRKQSAPQYYKGRAQTITLKGLSDIERVTQSLDTHECIGLGVFDIDDCQIVSKRDFEECDHDQGIRTRSKDHLSEPDVKLVLLDYDPDPYMPQDLQCASVEGLMAKLVEAIPEFEGIGYSGAPSTSAGIYKEGSDESYPGGGFHVYFVVQGVSLADLQCFLKVRLWNAGMGFISFARNGAMLERTIIDLSVLSPERLIYESRPVLGEGLKQKERQWTHVKGKAFKGSSDAQ